MTELRWLRFHSSENNGSHPTAVRDSDRHLRVLQYRQEEGPKGERWWGKWKDIPIVDIDDA